MYAGLPPEVNTGRLIAGAMAEPYLQTAARLAGPGRGIHCRAERLNRRNRGNGGDLARDGRRTGPGHAFAPYTGWMSTVIALAEQRAVAAAAQAASTPPLWSPPRRWGDRRKPRHPRRSWKARTSSATRRNPDGCQRVPVFCGPLGQGGRGHVRVPGRNRGEHHLPGLSARPPIMAAPVPAEAGLAAVLAKAAAAARQAPPAMPCSPPLKPKPSQKASRMRY